MKYEISGYVLFSSGLILILSFFIGLGPTIPAQGSWGVTLFPIFFLVFLLGVLEIICGLLNLIKQKFYERLSIISGVLSLLMGLLYLNTLYFWWLVLVLFISGIFLLYFVAKKSWK